MPGEMVPETAWLADLHHVLHSRGSGGCMHWNRQSTTCTHIRGPPRP